MIKKILVSLFILILVVVLGFVVFVSSQYDKDYSAEFPVTEINVVADSTMLARGEYLVYGPAHCGHCHAPEDRLADLERGEKVPLTGGFGLDIPPGVFNAPNITPDEKTGIGGYSDGELYRMLRHNVKANGQTTVDFMPFINMSDEDIYAVIGYLRTLEPIENEAKPTEWSFLGKMVLALGAVKPGVPDEPIPVKVEKSISIEYGKYMAYAVANCRGCHTERDMKTGEYIGEPYAGGLVFGPDNLTNGWAYVTPNLTDDPETGVMRGWTEEEFVKRMKAGRVHATSPMPWSALSNMDEGDLRAVFRYLKSLPPVKNEVKATATPPAEAAATL